VLEAVKKFVEPGVFQSPEGVSRLWTPWRLVPAAALMAWAGAGSLAQRFATTRITLRQWRPKQSLGRTYQGWIKALVRLSPRLLSLLSVSRIVARGRDPLGLWVALAARQVRLALRQNRCSVDGAWLLKRLGGALQDRYRRRAGKQARGWPHKKNEPPPGAPNIRVATREQVRPAQEPGAKDVAA